MLSIIAFIKSLIEFLQLGKFFYKEIAPTPIEKENSIDSKNAKEEEKAKKIGRPTWE